MQVLRDEFEKISAKYGCQDLHLDGFAPEQVYYQIEHLCCAVLDRSEAAIARLGIAYERPPAHGKICHEDHPEGGAEDCSDQGECSSGSTCTEGAHPPEGESLGSDDFNTFEDQISQMPACDAIKLLESRATRASENYSSDSEEDEDPSSDPDDQ